MTTPTPSKVDLRRQAERVMFDILYDQDTITRIGTFCQVHVGEFSREHRWRQTAVKDALKDLNRLGFIRGIEFSPGMASFHLEVPPAFSHLKQA